MNHLSPIAMMEWLDQTTVNGDRRKVLDHLDQCAQCRREVEFQQQLIQTARRAPLAVLSNDFTRSAMEHILPSLNTSWSRRILDNLGNMIGMAIVLTIIGYAFTHTSTSRDASSQPSQLSQVIHLVSDGLHRTGDFLKQESGKLLSMKSHLPLFGELGTMIMVTLLTLLALILLDRLFLQRLYHRNKSR